MSWNLAAMVQQVQQQQQQQAQIPWYNEYQALKGQLWANHDYEGFKNAIGQLDAKYGGNTGIGDMAGQDIANDQAGQHGPNTALSQLSNSPLSNPFSVVGMDLLGREQPGGMMDRAENTIQNRTGLPTATIGRYNQEYGPQTAALIAGGIYGAGELGGAEVAAPAGAAADTGAIGLTGTATAAAPASTLATDLAGMSGSSAAGGTAGATAGAAASGTFNDIDFNSVFGDNGNVGLTNTATAEAPPLTDMSQINLVPQGTGGLGTAAAGGTAATGLANSLGNSAPAPSPSGNDWIPDPNGQMPSGVTGANGLGNIFNNSGGSGGMGNIIGSGLGFLGNQQAQSQLMNLMQQGMNRADPFYSQRPQYQQLYNQYNTDPNFLQNDAVLKGMTDQSLRAVGSQDAAKGYLGSGNMLQDLTRTAGETIAPYALQRGQQLGIAAGAYTNPGAAAGITSSLAPAYSNMTQQGYGYLGNAVNGIANSGIGSAIGSGLNSLLGNIT